MYTPDIDSSLQILANAPMGIVITNPAGTILWCNKCLDEWLGGVGKSYLGRDESSLVDDGAPEGQLNGGPYQLTSGRWIQRNPISMLNGNRAVCYLDVSEQESLRKGQVMLAQQLEQFTTIDPISGLLNERAINSELESLVSRSRRYNNPLSVVLMELCRIGSIHETLGQVAIDKIVVAVSQLLRDQMRWADLLGRTDDGHFIFVLPETEFTPATALCSKIISQLRSLQITIDDGVTYQPESCFGIAEWQKGVDPGKLLSRAQDALRKAVQDGPYRIEQG